MHNCSTSYPITCCAPYHQALSIFMQVLSDPQKRDVYDIYGKEGLAAGLSVGTKLKNTEELKREWEEFKARQRRSREEATAQHRGVYQCKVCSSRTH